MGGCDGHVANDDVWPSRLPAFGLAPEKWWASWAWQDGGSRGFNSLNVGAERKRRLVRGHCRQKQNCRAPQPNTDRTVAMASTHALRAPGEWPVMAGDGAT